MRRRRRNEPLCTTWQPYNVFGRPDFDLTLTSQMLIVTPNPVTARAHGCGYEGNVILVDSRHDLLGFLPFRKGLHQPG